MRRNAGIAIALGCIFFILMRLLSPAFRTGFDGVTLGLTAIAAVGLLLPGWPARRQDDQEAPVETGAARDSLAADVTRLRERVTSLGWSVPEGGVYDALIRLSQQNPNAAICGAYATITLLVGQASTASPGDSLHDTLRAMISQKRIQPLYAQTLEDVVSQLDAYCTPNIPAAPDTDEAMLACALGTLAFLERTAA